MPQNGHERSDSSERTGDGPNSNSIKETPKNKIEDFFGNGTLKTNPFGDNISAEYGYRRAERIAAAVHLMTSHIEVSEPLRNSMRAESIQLLDHALLLQGELRAIGSENVRKMQSSIRKLISLVKLAGISGRVSSQNADILADALDELGNFLTTSQRSTLAESVALSRDDLVPRQTLKRETITQKGLSYVKRTVEKRDGDLKDKIHIKDSNVRKTSPSGSRAERIMDILRKGGLLGIKDIVSTLPEYSEKMIQRDLATMVDSGQVKKIGEKRWSRYEIVR